MDVRVARLLEGAESATGTAVIVDVFRAFTTAAFCVAAGAREVVLVARPEDALALRASDPSLFLTGEVGGRPIEGFDAGNSPSAIERLDLAGRRVVQRTSSGTQGVIAASRSADAVVLASFVIAGATARYLAANASEITLVAMGDGGMEVSEEDEACAAYLAALLSEERPGPTLAVSGLPDLLQRRAAAYWRSLGHDGWPPWFPRRDAELACEVDRLDFALPVVREGGLLVARPIRP